MSSDTIQTTLRLDQAEIDEVNRIKEALGKNTQNAAIRQMIADFLPHIELIEELQAKVNELTSELRRTKTSVAEFQGSLNRLLSIKTS